MPESRLQRTRENYRASSFTLTGAFPLEERTVFYIAMADMPSPAHASAQFCGCDPAVNHRCETHAND